MRSGIVSSTQGAVAVEFMPAFSLLLLAFFCFLQMAQVYTAGLVMRHATMVTGRYASVTHPSRFIPDPEDRMNDGRSRNPPLADVAAEGLGPWKKVVRVANAHAEHAGRDPWGDIQTTVQYEYRCHVPIAKFIVCQGGTLMRTVNVTSPLHGARYVLDPRKRRIWDVP